MKTFIHLLYVPTMNCNMRCSYCYLGEGTHEVNCEHSALDTLTYAVNKFKADDVIPFNISLHGGEVTTLPREDFREMCDYIQKYYAEERSLLEAFGFRIGTPHIKTNLFALDRHIDAIRDYHVSVSGSLDLPLSMHSRYRVDAAGHDTLPRILANIESLRQIDCHKKVSATIFKEHMAHIDEIIHDIRWLHENTCLDMNDFNFMFGFATESAKDTLTPLNKEEQVEFYRRMQDAFTGTELESGLNGAWFAEFTPNYCSGCENCGDKFFLLQRNGDIYSCVRGQGHPEFCYGNIYKDTVESILLTAHKRILEIHREVGFDESCAECPDFYRCRTGCPFVKKNNADPQSYTCLLQKELYKNMDPLEAPPNYVYDYLSEFHPQLAEKWWDPPKIMPDGMPSLESLIELDPKLQLVYDPNAFILHFNGRDIPLRSQLLKQSRNVYIYISGMTPLYLYVKKEVLEALCTEPVNNALYIMLLSGDMVVYGDEQRSKQMHAATHMVYKGILERLPSDREGYYRVDLGPIIDMYAGVIGKEPANIFFTTTALRDYHYAKQKNNAWYHIRAMNLPFQNAELLCMKLPV